MTTDSPSKPDGLDNRVDETASEAVRVPVARERVVLDRVEQEQIAARLSLRTRTEEAVIDEDLRSEHIDIERVPVGRVVSEYPQARHEDGITIVPVVEEVLVVQYRIVEEVRIIPRTETVRHKETVTLRQQEIHIEKMPPVGDDPAGA